MNDQQAEDLSKELLPNEHPPVKSQTASSWLLVILLGIILGIWFGIAIGKGQTYQPQIIVEQFLMKKFIMMKMFLSAVATALLVMSTLSYVKPEEFKTVRDKKVEGDRGLGATVIGGVLLGMGMAVSGSCPGTVYVQLGSGIFPGAVATLIGGILAVLVWTFIKDPVEKSWLFRAMPFGPKTLDALFGFPVWLISVVLALLMVIVVILLEYFFPYQMELDSYLQSYPGNSAYNFFGNTAWPPYVAGIMVGLIQLPLVSFLSSSIGSSSGMGVFTSLFLYPCFKENSFIKSKVTSNPVTYFQPIYLVFAAGGGAIASLSSNSFNSNPGLSIWLSFVGGFLILFGSMLGGGCTSGHGIAGMSSLSVPSFVSVAAMFAGGIPLAYILLSTGAYGESLSSWPDSY